MNRASVLILCSLAASAAVLDVVPDGELMQQQHSSRSQKGGLYRQQEPEEEPEEDVVFPLPDREEGLAFLQDELVPPPGYGNIVGPGRHYCYEPGLVYDGSAGNETDCVARCNATDDCQYMSFWRSGNNENRCRLTMGCTRFYGQSAQIVVFEKLPRNITVPQGYNLTHSPSKNWCSDRSYYHGPSESVEDCAAKCNEHIACQYFSFWRTDRNHYCRLTLFCRTFRQHDHSIVIFEKPPAVAPPAPAGYNLSRGPGRDWCADHSSYNGASTGLEDCAAKCNSKVECQFFTYWQTHTRKWCRLTLFCRTFRQQDEKIVIYAKPTPVAPPVPDGMNLSLHLGPGRDYCNEGSTYNGPSEGFEDCAAKCSNSADCGYFSYWQTHSHKWCRITLFCNKLRQQDHTIFIYKKPAPATPPAPLHYQLVHTASQNLCDDPDWRWRGRSTGLEDCAAKCTSYFRCEFFSFWLTGSSNWCQLTGACVNYTQQEHYIVIYDKLPPTAPQSPGNYSLTRGPGRDYCADRVYSNSKSDGVEDCAAKCDARVECQFFSFWLTGGRNTCWLTLFCRTFRQTNEHILIYAKPPPVAPPPAANHSLFMGPGRDYCGDYSVFSGRSGGYDDCVAKCTERGVDCGYMSFWRTGGHNWCRITRYCDRPLQQDESIVIYKKPEPVTPAAPLGYNLTHNLSKNLCKDGGRWHGNSGGLEDCANKCDDRFDCEFFQFWVSGGNNWCRLTSSCNEFSQQDHYIAIYAKLPPTAPEAPQGYNLTHGPSRDYCWPDRRIFSGASQGVDDCATKCDERQNCVYVNFFMTGGQNWCYLFTTCNGYRQLNHHIAIYKKGSPAAPAGYEVIEGIGNKYCNDVSSSFRGAAESMDDCATKCNGRPECHYFSFWLSGSSTNCVLSGSCSAFAEENNPIVVFEKTLPALSTSPPGYKVVEDEGNQFCGKVRYNVWQGYAERAACVAACGADPTCKYFTHSQPFAWCILSSDCDLKLKATTDMGYTIYEKAA